MSTMKFEVVIKAAGEVRDAEGNLISTSEVTFDKQTVSADQLSTIPTDELLAAGLTDAQINEIKGETK
jgi:hypothetical protein